MNYVVTLRFAYGSSYRLVYVLLGQRLQMLKMEVDSFVLLNLDVTVASLSASSTAFPFQIKV